MNIIKQFYDANGNKVFPLAYAQGGMKMDLLWANPSPTSVFAAQTVALDLSDYDFFVVSAFRTNDYATTPTFSGIIPKGVLAVIYGSEAGQANIYSRKITFSDSGVEFSTGYATGSTANSTADCIPDKIYGIKMSYIVPTQVLGLQYIEV